MSKTIYVYENWKGDEPNKIGVAKQYGISRSSIEDMRPAFMTKF